MNENKCPQCDSTQESHIKHGKTKKGTQRWKCKACGKVFSDDLTRGRPMIGSKPMTNLERWHRWKNKQSSG